MKKRQKAKATAAPRLSAKERSTLLEQLPPPMRALGEYLLDEMLSTKKGEAMKMPKNAFFDAQAYVDPSRLFASGLFNSYNPSILVTRKGLQVFDEMKLDEQVKLALAFKKLACLAPGWQVNSPGDQEDDWEVTKFVRDNLKNFQGGWSGAVKKIMGAIDYGFSLTEKIFAKPADAPAWAKGKVTLLKLNACKPHYLDFELDPYGTVIRIIQRWVPGSGASIPEKSFSPEKFVLYSYDKEHENPYGKSDLEAAYRPWWAKDNAYKWFVTMLERFGMPPLFLMYDPNDYQGNQIEQLKKIVRNIQNATLGILPRSKKEGLEFWTQQLSQGAREVFISALGRFDLDIAKAVLMPSHIGGTTETKDQGSGGSLARSNVHFKMFMFVVSELQRELCTVINEQVVRPLCDLNFPNLESYPEFVLNDVDDEIEVKIFELWEKFVTGKIVGRTPDDEKYIRSALGFPENEDIVLEDLPADAALKSTEGLERDKMDQSDKLTRDTTKEGHKLERERMDREDRRAKEAAKQKAKERPRAMAEEEQTEDMRSYAQANDGEWFMVNGHPVCLKRLKEAA